MITRFRVEAKHEDKDRLQEQLFAAASRIQVMEHYDAAELDGEWEITDDRIEGRPGAYRGRMVFVFTPYEVERGHD